MPTEELLDVTPQYFGILREAHDHKLRRADALMEFMLAQLTACTINFGMRGPKKPVSTSDLMPSRRAPAKPAAARRESKQKIADRLRRQMAALMK